MKRGGWRVLREERVKLRRKERMWERETKDRTEQQ